MELRELRIGNYVMYEQTTHIISELNQEKCSSYWVESVKEDNYIHNYNEIKPIPLTEEWLLKFGFYDKGYSLCIGDFELTFSAKIISTNERRGFFLGDNFPECFRISIRFVHQLQNLYSALVGEELTTKQTV